MGAGGKPFAQQDDNSGIDTSQFFGEHQVINTAEFPPFFFGFVMPVDAKEVAWV